MRKIIISVIVVLLLIGSAFFMVNGINNVGIKGIKGLNEKNKTIEQKISELSNAISVTYVNTESNLKSTASTLQSSKTEYENQAALSNSSSPSYASQLEKYDIDYLWTKIGNHAKNENVVIKMDLVSGGASQNLYNLNFTVTGSYMDTTNFIYDIENDSKLGFKIDEFKMVPGGSDALTTTFICKEIPINVGKVDDSTQTTTSNGSTDGAANGTSSTQTQSSGASTNSTSTTNTSGTTSTGTSTQSTSTNTSSTTTNTVNTSTPTTTPSY